MFDCAHGTKAGEVAQLLGDCPSQLVEADSAAVSETVKASHRTGHQRYKPEKKA